MAIFKKYKVIFISLFIYLILRYLIVYIFIWLMSSPYPVIDDDFFIENIDRYNDVKNYLTQNNINCRGYRPYEPSIKDCNKKISFDYSDKMIDLKIYSVISNNGIIKFVIFNIADKGSEVSYVYSGDIKDNMKLIKDDWYKIDNVSFINWVFK